MSSAPYKIVLWGIGRNYNAHLSILKMWEEKKIIKVIAVTAKEVPAIKKLDGWCVVHKEKLPETDFDYIMVCNTQNIDEIVNTALSLGIPRQRLIPSRVMDIPYFDWGRYIRILESHLSIISCNCWGGAVYNTLGMECLSPFKNLWVSAENLISMAPVLKEYMQRELVFSRWETDGHSGRKYPVMSLGNIEVHCNHDTDSEEARSKWDRRKNKINYENLLFMIYTENTKTVEKFTALNVKHKICFLPRYMDGGNDHNIWGLNLLPGQEELWECVNASVGCGGINFDILKMLDGVKEYRYE